jgi:hypothetical protein
LTALFSTLSRICCSRLASPTTASGTFGPNTALRVRPFLRANEPISPTAPSMQSRSAKGTASSSMRPASILEKSRMSLMIASSASPLRRIVETDSRCSSSSSLRISSSLMPSIAFIGVRISWLMAARNVPFAAFAASAAARASFASSSRLWISSKRRAFSIAVAANAAKAFAIWACSAV